MIAARDLPHGYTPSVCTWNIDGFPSCPTTSRDFKKRQAIVDNIHALSKLYDIINLQETHLPTTGDHSLALQLTFPTHYITHSNLSSNSAGVATLYTKRFTDIYTHQIEASSVPQQGRALRDVWAPHSAHQLQHITNDNLYLPVKDDSLTILILDNLRSPAFAPPDHSTHFVQGDFNFITSKQDCARYTPHYQMSKKLTKSFDSFLTHFGLTEAYQPTHTCHKIVRKVGSTAPSTSSRLDRHYNNFSEAHKALRTPTAHIPTVPHLPATPGRPSDHAALGVHFPSTDPRANPNHLSPPRIPAYVISSPLFAAKVQAELEHRVQYSQDPFANIRAVKSCMLGISKKLTSQRRLLATTHLSKIQTHIAALRHLDGPQSTAEKVASLHRVALSNPDLTPLIPPRLAPLPSPNAMKDVETALRNSLNNLYKDTSALNPAPNFMAQAKSILPSDQLRLVSIDSPNPSDPPITAPNKIALATKLFWEKHWAAGNTTEPHLSHLLGQYNKTIPPEHLPAEAALEDILLVLRTKKLSFTPGPDGVPPAAYAAVSKHCANNNLFDIVGHTFLATTMAIGSGLPLPHDFNHTILRILPKKSPHSKITDTRPLQTPNGDNRIIANTLILILLPALIIHLDVDQKGFITGRDFKDHIRNMTQCYYDSLTKKQVGAILFIDMRKAFDSVSHAAFLRILRHIGLPDYHVRLAASLWTRVLAIPGVANSIFALHSFHIHKGCKQGCPFSPILFVIVLDVLIHLTKVQVKPAVRVFAMADDTAFHLHDLSSYVPLTALIDDFGRATGLSVNQGRGKSGILLTYETPTTIFQRTQPDRPIPRPPPERPELPCVACHTFFHDLHDLETTTLLCSTCTTPYHPACLSPPIDPNLLPSGDWFCPLCTALRSSRFPDIQVVNEFPYLGIPIGLTITIADIFAQPIAKLVKRANLYLPARSAFSKHRRIMLANTFLLSLFSYHCSLYLLPSSTLKRINSLITPWLGTRGTLSNGMLTHPKSQFGLRSPLTDISLHNIALLIMDAGHERNLGITPGLHHPKPAHTLRSSLIANDHLIAARVTYHATTGTDKEWSNAIHCHPSVGHLRRILTRAPPTAAKRKTSLAAKIRKLFAPPQGITKHDADAFSDNLLHNYNTLPAATPDHLRIIFILQMYNALPYAHRIRYWAPPDAGDTLCLFCGQDNETMTHVYFACPAIHAAKTKIDTYLPYFTSLSFSASQLLETPAYYLNMPSASTLNATRASFFFHFSGPIFLFNVSIWNARSLIKFHADTALSIDNSARAITKTFWDLCMGTDGIAAAIPSFLDVSAIDQAWIFPPPPVPP